MNRQKLSVHTLMCLLACATAACSNDLEQKEIPAPEEGGRITVTAGAGMPQNQPSTRVDFNEATDGSQLEITWRDDPQNPETFSVFSGADDTNPSTFTLESVDPSDPHQASFTGEITPTVDGTTYYALYPAVSTGSTNATATAGTIPLNLTAQTGKLDENKLYMYGSSLYEPNKALNFSFNHLTSIVKVTMQFPAEIKANQPANMPIENIKASTRALSGGQMTDVTFAADGLYLTAKADLSTGGDPSYTYPSPADGSITLSDPISLSSETQPSATVYLYVLPGGLTNFKVKAKADGKSYIATISADITIDAGKMYTKTVEMEADPLADAKVGDFYCKGSDGNGYLVSGDAALTEEQVNECISIVYCTDTERIGEAAKDALAKNNVTTPHGLVMALTNAHEGCRWGDNSKDENGSVDGSDPFLNNTANAKMMYENVNGYAETHWILNTYKDGTTLRDTYSAFYHANLYGTANNGKYAAPANTTGWFIPSMGQWWDILSNLGEINLSDYQTSEKPSISTNESNKAVDNMNKYLDKIKHAKKISTPELFWSSSEYSSGSACGVDFYSNGYLNLYGGNKNYSGGKVRCVFAF